MSQDLLLGIDVGTTNCKAAVFDAQGQQLSIGRMATPLRRPQAGWAEHDAEELWQAVVAAIRDALATVDPQQIRGVAVASFAEAGTLLDAAGQPLTPLIAWYDGRTDEQYRWWLEQIPQEWAMAMTRLPAKPVFSLFKLLWLRDHAPEAYQHADRWLHAADYIAFRLCGVAATDYSMACRTMLFDLEQRCWADPLIARAGLRRDLFAPLVPSGSALGTVTATASAATGLPTTATVASGGHDHVCGAFAAGVRSPGECLDSMGTAEASFLPLHESPPVAAARAGGSLGAHVARGQHYAMIGVYTSGAVVSWAADTLFAGSDRFAQMEQAAGKVPPGSRGVLFLPRLAANQRGAFAGLTLAADTAAMARAVYEGVAYEWRRMLSTLEQALHVQSNAIYVIGGGTRSLLWTQIKADIIQRPLQILAIEESTALGAALLAGLAAGVYRDENEAIAGTRRIARVVIPDPEQSANYEQRYQQAYLPLVGALDETNAALARLG